MAMLHREPEPQNTNVLYNQKQNKTIYLCVPMCPCICLVVLKGICIRAKTVFPCEFFKNSNRFNVLLYAGKDYVSCFNY